MGKYVCNHLPQAERRAVDDDVGEDVALNDVDGEAQVGADDSVYTEGCRIVTVNLTVSAYFCGNKDVQTPSVFTFCKHILISFTAANLHCSALSLILFLLKILCTRTDTHIPVRQR